MMLRFVTFDATGTLLRTKKPVGEIYAEVGEMWGVKADPSSLLSSFKASFKEESIRKPNFGRGNAEGWDAWWRGVVTSTFHSATGSHHPNINKLADHLIKVFSGKEGWALADGSLSSLQQLKKENIHLGVISNFDARLVGILKELQIHHFFTFILTSYDCNFLKPDIRIFKNAEALFEKELSTNFNPEAALHVGDHLENDYYGAKNAGWNAALISNDCVKEDMFIVKDLEHFKNRFLEVCK